MQLPLPVNSRAQYALYLSALLVVAATASVALSVQRPEALTLGDYQAYSCTGEGRGERSLQLLTLTSLYAPEMAERLCDDPLIGREFPGVNIAWHPRSYLTAEHILEGRFDVFWNRRHLLLGMVPEFDDYYSPLLHTPNYPVYFISRHALPELSAGQLEGRVVGLLADTRSQTFYLQAMNALHRAGIELADTQRRLFPDVHALFGAFASGEVDIISSPLYLADRFGVSYADSLLIEEKVPSGTWYIKNSLLGSGVECSLLRALTMMGPVFHADAVMATEVNCP